jgi:microcystin-dependent protein
MEPYLGQITMAGFAFPPSGWALCNGALMNIQQNAALFSLLSNYYGGDGKTTFQLPNLCGRTPIGYLQGTGLSAYQLGNKAGAESVALSAQTVPAHTHAVAASTIKATKGSNGAILAAVVDKTSGAAVPAFAAPASTVALSNPLAAAAGGGHENHQPYSTVNFIIALSGVYPQRP